ncbi:MAG TPA: cobaltochelatase subunit CobN, partial [Deltaproteobacteria bacterium]|nr:cobaltochelatase subunit CobN [Deltaproteobacteria bacterium]
MMMGDFNSRTSIGVIKNIRSRFPKQSRNIDFSVITGKTREQVQFSLSKSVSPGKASGIGLVHIMDRRLVESLKPRMAEMIKNGVRVYAVGGNYTEEDEQFGLINDETVNSYYQENGLENMTQLLLFLLNRDCGQDVTYAAPVKVPQNGFYLRHENRTVSSYEEYIKAYKSRPGPWVGIPFFKTSFNAGEMQLVDAIVDRLESQGINAIPIFGFPSEVAVKR